MPTFPRPYDPTPVPLTYVVYWPKARVLKIGVANHMGRVRKHVKSGATVMVLLRDRPRGDERRALQKLEESYYPSAFEDWREARDILGDNGSGYTECFYVPTGDLPGAVRMILAAIAVG